MSTYVLVAGEPQVGALVEAAAGLGTPVVAVVVGSQAVAQGVAGGAVSRVVWIDPADRPAEAFAADVAGVVAADPGVVFAGRRPSERILLGAVAAKLGAPVVSGIHSVTAEGATTVVDHDTFGGIAREVVAFDGPVVCVMDGGAPVTGGSGEVAAASANPAAITLTSLTPRTEAAVDLSAAPRIVSVGRGLKAVEDLGIVEDLAAALNAELSCSRPVAEGLEWLPRDRYVGISGQHVAPDVYVMVGISGQLQHMSGCRGAKTIVAINSDPDAPAIAEADYILVGDLYQLVPAIAQAARAR